ncbi:uncharacterized protein N7515_003546 [Penicillium bovifimosum]|uniref:Defect at low temperature protein 1 n=1 Tax=Penicillium bovifimosum TaxID=126998 RepID=A0A9W9H5A2_9EURO|nr:uncharacterized protein N7515_003546 [Penicillium bovifimosum]KAJ5138698.1 hypothetical protein N7515_003546 [Penicillium bovifimosum]
MAGRLERFLNTTGFTFFALILLALIGLTPVDAVYQCYETRRLTNIFFIIGAYVITFIIAALIYATRIYTNRSTLSGIPKAWIPVEKEDVSKSVRRLVKEGLAHSAIIAYQARPRDVSTDEDNFQHYKPLLIDRERPPWGHIEHCGWSSPTSPDLPNLPYRTVIQELPSLIEAKAVSLAPADSFAPPDPFGSPGDYTTPSLPDTRVVEVLQRPASMGLREYIRHLTSLGAIYPPELGADFLALYERARFSRHSLHETEFRELMHLFAEILRGMTSLAPPVLEEIRDSASYRRAYSQSAIGNTDEEGYTTDTVEHYGYDGALEPMRSDSIRPSNSSTWDSQSGYDTAPSIQRPVSELSAGFSSYAPRSPRTPSIRSLRRVASGQSGASGGSVIRLTQPQDPTELPYTIDYAGRRQ